MDAYGNVTNGGSASSSYLSHDTTKDGSGTPTTWTIDKSSDCTTLAYQDTNPQASDTLILGYPKVTGNCGNVTVEFSSMDIITGDPTTVNAALATRCAGLTAGYAGTASASMSVTLSDSGVAFIASSSTSLTRNIFSLGGTLWGTFTDTSSFSYSTTTTLGGSHAYSDVVADAVALAGQWDLSDDAVYPWRLDGQTWLNPLVTRDAIPGGPAPAAGTASPPC